MGKRNINDAHPRLQKAWAFVDTMWPLRYPNDPKPFLTEVHRSNDEQRALFAQGRRPFNEVNRLRQVAGLALITEQENRRKVTNAGVGSSKHNKSPAEALDIWFARNKQLIDEDRLWKQLVNLMKEADPGIIWGGNFKTIIDKPHFEI